MKRFIILFSFVLLVMSCSRDAEFIESEGKYAYPLDSLKEGKTFVFRKINSEEYSFTDQKLITEGGVDYVVVESYDLKRKNTAQRWEVNKYGMKLVEGFVYYYPDSTRNEYIKLKSESLACEDVDDGQAYNGTVIQHKVSTGKFSGEFTSRGTYLREDKVLVFNKELDAIVFREEMRTKTWIKYVPFFSTETIYQGENFYAQGYGIVRYTISGGKNAGEWVLSDIWDMI